MKPETIKKKKNLILLICKLSFIVSKVLKTSFRWCHQPVLWKFHKHLSSFAIEFSEKKRKAPQNELDKSLNVSKNHEATDISTQKKPHLKLHCSLFHRLCITISYSSAFHYMWNKSLLNKYLIHSNTSRQSGISHNFRR